MLIQGQDYPIVPHQDCGDEDCCGCLWIRDRPDDPGQVDLVCNECDVVVGTVPAQVAVQTLVKLVSAEICTAVCPHCRTVNSFSGFSVIDAFVCQHCGEGAKVERTVQ